MRGSPQVRRPLRFFCPTASLLEGVLPYRFAAWGRAARPLRCLRACCPTASLP